MKSLLVTTATLMISAFTFIPGAQAENRTFNNPKVSGDRLDLCLNWGQGCGKPAADAWCASRGFEQSNGHVVANDIGASTPTRLITTGAVCDQGFCDGFASVTCFKPSSHQVYANPKIQGMRLDLCVNWGEGCGEPAANAYCQRKGWNASNAHVVAHDIGASAPTRLIGTGAVCDQGFCDGFQTITCTN